MRAKKLSEEITGQQRMLPGPKMLELETSVRGRIQTYVVSRGFFCIRNAVVPGAKGREAGGCGTGSSDLHAIVRGRAVWIETKREKLGRERPAQVEFIAAVRAAGGVAGFAKTVEEAALLIDEALR